MLADMLTLDEKLTVLETAVRAFRHEVKSFGPRLDGIESLASAGSASGLHMSLAPGYTAVSPDAGLYIPNGSIHLEISKCPSAPVLRVSPEDEQNIPDYIVIQLNLGAQFLRNRAEVSVAASWVGRPLKPQIECRFVSDDAIIRTDVAEVNMEASGSSLHALARFELPACIQRSDSIDQARLCLLFDKRVLGSEITSLTAH